MPVIMILYTIICLFIASLLVWNFLKEKESPDRMLHYLIVLIPLILRILRVK